MSIQRPIFAPASSWRPPKVSDLPSWAGAKRIAIDTETNDPQLKSMGPGVRRDGYIVGISFAIEDGPAHYLPIAHGAAEDNLDPGHVWAYLKDQARSFKGTLVGANLPYDLDYLAQAGVNFTPDWYRDVQVAEPLIDDLQDSYSLENIAARHGMPGKDENLLREAADAFRVDPKTGLWKLPARYVGPYAEQDVRLPLKLIRRQEREIDNQEIWPIYDLESRVLPVLLRMRRRGVRVDLSRLEAVERMSVEREQAALDEIHSSTGVRVALGDVWKSGPLAQALEKIGVVIPRTAKTDMPSVTRQLLDSIDHPVAKAILAARRANKIRTTFVQSIKDHQVNGRVHPTFNQLRRTADYEGDDEQGARYGRLSCTDPNLQQQIARDPVFKKVWRSIFLADEDMQWVCADFSSQEPRWMTHYAEITGCSGASKAAERYRTDLNLDPHTMMAQVVYSQPADWVPPKETREQCKIIALGVCYGMGGAKMCRSLGLPTKWVQTKRGMLEVAGDEGAAILDTFHRGAPYVRELSDRVKAQAAKRGWIRTVLGRRCRFPEGPNGYEYTHKALNRLIQGSSADQTKRAMVMADDAGLAIQLQVHDEIDMSVTNREQADMLAQIMREAVPANVPWRIDTEIGPSWGELS